MVVIESWQDVACEQPSAVPDEAQRVLQRDTEAIVYCYHTLRALPVQSL